MPDKSDISSIILAAGFSSRMKQAKFSLMFDKKRTFLEKIVQEYLNFNCREIIVVLNSEGIKQLTEMNLSFPENVRFVLNKFPERERFFSLQTGLKVIQNCSNAFIQNSDNPFVNQILLDTIFNQKDKADYIVPTYNERGGHPILMNKHIINKISSEKKNDFNLKEYLKGFSKKNITVNDEKIMININDMNIYNKLF